MATSGFLTALQCIKFVFGRGSAPDPAGELTALPRPPSWFNGELLLRGRGGKERKDRNASISLSIKLNIRLMLVGLPAWRKTDRPASV